MKHINKERLTKTFKELAKIPSPSGQEERISKVLTEKLENLGLVVKKDTYGNFVAKLAGKGEPVVLCAHMDTVAVSKDVINVIVDEDKGEIRSDGMTILGADNKDSISAILEMLEVVKENKLLYHSLEIIFTREEEAISGGARSLDLSLISGRECFISDQAEPYGTITLTAPYLYAFNVDIQGIKCHVKEPEKGINAVRIMATAISHPEMPIGRIDSLTTVNIGSVIAGLRSVIDEPGKAISDLRQAGRNSVPDLAHVYGEVRGADEKKVREVLSSIEKIFATVGKLFNGILTFSVEKKADGYIFMKDDPLVARVASIFIDQQVNVEYFDSVGGSDANILEKNGIHSIVFSSAHRNNHQTDEYLIIEDLMKLADFYVKLITKI